MCPDLEVTPEEEEEILKTAQEEKEVQDEVLEAEGQEKLTEKAVEDIVEVSEEKDQEFEGVDKDEDIPKGKEKDYGI